MSVLLYLILGKKDFNQVLAELNVRRYFLDPVHRQLKHLQIVEQLNVFQTVDVLEFLIQNVDFLDFLHAQLL